MSENPAHYTAEQSADPHKEHEERRQKQAATSKGLDFLRGLGCHSDVISFIKSRDDNEAYSTITTILGAHQKVADQALATFAKLYKCVDLADEGEHSLAESIYNLVMESELWWSLPTDTHDTPTLMIKNSDAPYWTPLYEFHVRMEEVDTLFNRLESLACEADGEKGYDDADVQAYIDTYGRLTPIVSYRVCVELPQKH